MKELKDLPGIDLVLVANDFEWKVAAAWTAEVGKVTAINKLPKLGGATSDLIFDGKYAKALASLSKKLGLQDEAPTQVKAQTK